MTFRIELENVRGLSIDVVDPILIVYKDNEFLFAIEEDEVDELIEKLYPWKRGLM